MRLINPKVEIIPQEDGLLGVYKQIEIAGRTCYKSEDKITDSSAIDFVKRMILSGHNAMLEHGTIYLNHVGINNPLAKYNRDKFSEYDRYYVGDGNIFEEIDEYVTTNLRVLIENDWVEDLKYLSDPMPMHKRRVTVRFTCDRGVSHELVRHRVFSFAQESTRYCNYSKDKFGKEITCIKPSWYDESEEFIQLSFSNALTEMEREYFALLTAGRTPQQARQVLPTALKTEVVMTGLVDDWVDFFELRCAANAHPDMQVLAKDLYKQFEERKLI